MILVLFIAMLLDPGQSPASPVSLARAPCWSPSILKYNKYIPKITAVVQSDIPKLLGW